MKRFLPLLAVFCFCSDVLADDKASAPPFPKAAQSTPVANTNAALEAVLAELATPAKRLPFKSVIQATTGHRVLDFDTNNAAHGELRKKILQAAALAGERARREGIATARANEAGNHIEVFVRAAMKDNGLSARVPVTSEGRAQSVGYPDIEITGATPCCVVWAVVAL